MHFEKYHSGGNDYIIIESEEEKEYSALARFILNVHVGVGGDGLIVYNKSNNEMKIYNKDGTLAEFCGNGIRCLGLYCYQKKYFSTREFVIKCSGKHYFIDIVDILKQEVSVSTGDYDYENGVNEEYLDDFNELLARLNLNGFYLYCGVPHYLIFIEDLEQAFLENIGQILSNHPYFENGTNIDFVHILNRKVIRLKTYERGVGLTHSCGSGMMACFKILKDLDYVTDPLNLILDLGIARVYEKDNRITLTSIITKVFEGELC